MSDTSQPPMPEPIYVSSGQPPMPEPVNVSSGQPPMPEPVNLSSGQPPMPDPAHALPGQPSVPQPVNTRPGHPLAALPRKLGLLADLTGTWVGTGFNVISLPDFDAAPPSTGPATFRLLLNSTIETLQFTPVGGSVPNRGVVTAIGTSTGQPDITLNGLHYLQRVSDLTTNQALHIEPGFWLSIPPTTVFPPQPAATIARLSTIPHGDSLTAPGGGFGISGGPEIAAVSTLPSKGGTVLGSPYTIPFQNPPLPRNFKPPYVLNPNLALQEAILGQNITDTVVLIVSTNATNLTTPTPAIPQDPNPAGTVINIPAPSGGITNIPFVVQNANATQMDAIFWIEKVLQPDGSTFMQLQYTQTVILNFLGINWPHVSVATLVKQ
jgi:hypothetical protein